MNTSNSDMVMGKPTKGAEPSIRDVTSREKVLPKFGFMCTNAYKDPATEIRDFTVTVTEQTDPEGHLVTSFYTTWLYHNISEDDRYKNPLHFAIMLHDVNENTLETYQGISPRSSCNQWDKQVIPQTRAINNYIDIVDHVAVYWTYSSPYEGKC